MEKFDLKEVQEGTVAQSKKLKLSEVNNALIIQIYDVLKRDNEDIRKTFPKWISNMCHISFSEINLTALVPKMYRTIKKVKGLRGKGKEEFLKSVFSIPTSTASRPEVQEFKPVLDQQESDDTEKKYLKSMECLKERRYKVNELSEKNKQLKRKYERALKRSDDHKVIKKRFIEEDKTVKEKMKGKDKIISYQEKRISALKKSVKQLKQKKLMNDRQLKMTKMQLDSTVIEKERLSERNANLESEALSIEETKQKLNSSETNVDYLTSLLEDSPNLELFDSNTGKYSDSTFQCVMNLTDLKVPTEKVGNVIKEVMSLCGKTPNRVPSATTVNRIVDSKLSVAQKQISHVLKSKKETTLYTDETSKFGKSIQTYVVTDESQTSYILGLREMYNKSGQSTLDTLKEILQDISTHCYSKEKSKDLDVGYQLLANIRDTMSDRASTEKTFNKLLEEFRSQILHKVIDNWDGLSDEEKKLCSKMNNFFCGLHLLVGMADTCEMALKKFEESFLDGKDAGSSKLPELKKFHRSESGTLRLIRTSCKAFAVGEDEKNGVSLQWKTFLARKKERNHILRFKHNRFNMVFLLGKAILYHHEDVDFFLNEVHGQQNTLLRAVSYDIKEPLYIAGVRALGLISQFITTPLWRLIEEKGHILDMNERYQKLVEFLEKGASNVEFMSEFITGEETPFDSSLDLDDKLVKSLVTPNDDIDSILIPLLQQLFQVMNILLRRMVSDHLPGGKYWAASIELTEASKSTMKHNKLPEFVFGQLDQLLRYRPNATLLTNESYLVYSHNKTGDWFDQLPNEEKHRLIEESRREGKEIRKLFKSRLNDIQRRRTEAQKQKQELLKEKEKKRLKNAEDLTNDVSYYGLWQSHGQVEEAFTNLPVKEQRKAIEAQLKFRKTVLQQKNPDKTVFNLSRKSESGKYEKLSIDVLKDNLYKLIDDTLRSPTTEVTRDSVPLLVGKNIEHDFSDGITYKGHVISVVPGFPQWYNVSYENDDSVYAYNLQQDYAKGDLRFSL